MTCHLTDVLIGKIYILHIQLLIISLYSYICSYYYQLPSLSNQLFFQSLQVGTKSDLLEVTGAVLFYKPHTHLHVHPNNLVQRLHTTGLFMQFFPSILLKPEKAMGMTGTLTESCNNSNCNHKILLLLLLCD